MKTTTITSQIKRMIASENTLIVSNHSGGKDSQAMYLYLKKVVPASRLVVIHSHLPLVEWDGTVDFIKDTIKSELFVVQAKKTFFDMVDRRYEKDPSKPCFPSPSYRQCTSDLKRDPIAKQIRQICNDRGFTQVLNCMGIRAEESSARAKKDTFKKVARESNSKRTVYEWYPIHNWLVADVFGFIKENDQAPFWVYKAGLSRKSCSFCIMASDKDLKLAAKLRPELLEKYDEYETRTGHVMIMPSKTHGKRTLKQIINSNTSSCNGGECKF